MIKSLYEIDWLDRVELPFSNANANHLRQVEAVLVVSTQPSRVRIPLGGSLNNSAYPVSLPLFIIFIIIVVVIVGIIIIAQLTDDTML